MRVVAVGGLPGAGKSVLAGALAARMGAEWLRSDVLRKELAGVAPGLRLPPAAYTPEASARVYAAMWARARAVLARGGAVVLDAVHLRAAERAAAAALSPAFCGLWLEVSAEVAAARAGARRGDVSDADAAVVRRMAALDPGPIDWARLDAAAAPDDILAAAWRQIAGG